MKKYFIFILALIIVNTVDSQDWQWQNPLPQGNTLRAVYFPDVNTGYAVGDLGTMIKTVDAGASWTVLWSGSNKHLYAVYFSNANTGYAVGVGGTILKTIDGGTT